MTQNTNNEAHQRNTAATAADGVKCELDGVYVHSIKSYLEVAHPTVSLEEYSARYPDAQLRSAKLEAAHAKKLAASSNAAASAMAMQTGAAAVIQLHPGMDGWSFLPPRKDTFANVFELGNIAAAKSGKGNDIEIEVLGTAGDMLRPFVPNIDPNYIYNIDILKSVMMAFVLKFPMLAWGLHGTGKTTVIEQFCARTNRPMIRVQHTATTEEAHILGQFILKAGPQGSYTEFEPGPLAVAMRYGMVYLADEYDFALPNVTAVYQPVLEGKALVIKEAPPEWRVVEPHPNFRFAATGNTNGAGDETGLYQGTQLQNAANYSRFGITVEINYMPEKQEIAVVAAQGGIHVEDAEKLVKIATNIREAFQRSEIGVTVSPRELINAAKLGRTLGAKWKQGLDLAFLNRTSTIDRQAITDMAQRYLA